MDTNDDNCFKSISFPFSPFFSLFSLLFFSKSVSFAPTYFLSRFTDSRVVPSYSFYFSFYSTSSLFFVRTISFRAHHHHHLLLIFLSFSRLFFFFFLAEYGGERLNRTHILQLIMMMIRYNDTLIHFFCLLY